VASLSGEEEDGLGGVGADGLALWLKLLTDLKVGKGDDD
jgi:hypothetical protein